jgi:tRNA pseudouridine32 synthase/23S rRNA pseudouridine746 synthase
VPPLPLRDGVDATRLVVAAEEAGLPLLQVLTTRFPGTEAYLAGEFAKAAVVGSDGAALGPGTVVGDRMAVWLYRELPVEAEVPFAMPILYGDERIVVVDKPHFLATMPRGSRVVQSALVRLRRQLGEPDLAPAHRLDRLTAGVLLFTRDKAVRGAYQQLFASGTARKTYRALAPIVDRSWPVTVESRIEKTPGIMRAFEIPGPPNARSVIEFDGAHPAGPAGTVGRYTLRPHTGKTHQLRLHMAGLGAPILGDPLYPEQLPWRADDDFTDPLRLLAERLEFVDPIDGTEREFVSERRPEWTR